MADSISLAECKDQGSQDSICAAIEASDEAEAKLLVTLAHDLPVELEWRFVEARPDDWSPFCDGFRKAEWMQWPAS